MRNLRQYLLGFFLLGLSSAGLAINILNNNLYNVDLNFQSNTLMNIYQGGRLCIKDPRSLKSLPLPFTSIIALSISADATTNQCFYFMT
jgi:hypothetical protein